MATTIRDVVDSALSEVYGQAQTIDATTFLSEPMTPDSLAVTVTDASLFSRGMIQVDDELMLVSEVDRPNHLLALRYGTARGVRATEATTHDVGALVTMAPAIPRYRAVQAVAETLTASNGLFRTDSLEFPFIAARRAYPLPVAVDNILSVTWIPTGPELDWVAVRRWTWDRHNRDLILGDDITPGRTVRVHYSTVPTVPDQDADFSETGLPNSCLDVIRLGAAWRMTSFIEPFNLLARSAEGEAMDRNKTAQTRLAVAQYFFQMYASRLTEEVADLQSRHPVRQHWVGTY